MYNYRYITDFDTRDMEVEYHDVVIIGSGIAGVYTALELDSRLDVAILTKESIDISNSALAQGGIAVSLDKEDSPELHFRDTLYAGAGLCEEDAVWVLVNEAAQNIEKLCEFGVNFDKKGPDELSLTREGAHSKNRIIHAGDTTGKEVCDTLISVVRTRENIQILERMFAVDLLVQDHICHGIITYDEQLDKLRLYRAKAVICATGGFGQIYSNTTNPQVATGDGVCLAYRAGVGLADLEFIQFHPTVLHHPENMNFLISEAVRGEGAILRNVEGKRFMPEYHDLKELAPRDVVSRAIFAEMQKTASSHVLLDITFKSREYLENRFPNIFKTCLSYGIDISKDYIPVAPAEHYCMGGIQTDIYGRTNIEGFYACGEVACTGIHGANRLASNSLLEGLVFGAKIAKEINCKVEMYAGGMQEPHIEYHTQRTTKTLDIEKARTEIQSIMTHNVGIIRNRKGLEEAQERLQVFAEEWHHVQACDPRVFEVVNLLLLSQLVTDSALRREESRGAHYRSDFNQTKDMFWKKKIIQQVEMQE